MGHIPAGVKNRPMMHGSNVRQKDPTDGAVFLFYSCNNRVILCLDKKFLQTQLRPPWDGLNFVTDLRQSTRLEGYALKGRIKTVNRPRRLNFLLTPILGE